jgi:hypothetical protein
MLKTCKSSQAIAYIILITKLFLLGKSRRDRKLNKWAFSEIFHFERKSLKGFKIA